jgi:uncharacterized protein YcbK (DUF882 family)
VIEEMGLSYKDFECKCPYVTCNYKHDQAVVDYRLIDALYKIYKYYENRYSDKDVKMVVNSGCRCKHHNALVGGIDNSKHIEGLAVDFEVHVDGVKLRAYLIADIIGKLVDLKVFDYVNKNSFVIHLEIDF